MRMVICIMCSDEFEAKCWNVKTCSKDCHKEYKRLEANRRYHGDPDLHQKRHREWSKNNSKKHKEVTKSWIINNQERFKESCRKYGEENRATISKKYCQRLQTDVNFKLSKRLRSRLNSAIKNSQKVGSAVKDLGCSIEELKKHLEAQFQPGMSWNNWSFEGWHIDHIKPLSKFNLTDKEEFIKACHFSNLQPLWSGDNLKKGNK